MAKFCGKCGTKLDEATGLCPNCNSAKIKADSVQNGSTENTEQKQEAIPNSEQPLSKKDKRKKRKADKKAAKKAKKKEKWAKLTFGQKVRKLFLKLLISIALISTLCCLAVGGLSYYGVIEISLVNEILATFGLDPNTGGSVDEYRIEAPDANSYYKDNSDIVSEIGANDSDDVLTEAEVYAELTGRGFGGYPITAEYTMDGQYSEATEITDTSSTKHPMYQTYYVSAEGEFWTIFVINGKVMANPVSYNLESTREVQLIISETEAIMSYNSTTDKFYETIPNESALCVIVVDKIDATTLDSLTAGEIDDYE